MAPERLFFTDSDEANAQVAADPLALLVGFVLDQQVTVQKAFLGPLALRERLGAFDAETLASADLEPVFRAQPAIHRFPGAMAGRVHDLAVHVRDRYDGDAARVWTYQAAKRARKAERSRTGAPLGARRGSPRRPADGTGSVQGGRARENRRRPDSNLGRWRAFWSTCVFSPSRCAVGGDNSW